MLHVHYFTFGPFQENTYILYDETKEAVIIDPGCFNASEQMELKSFIEDEKLQVKYNLNTHCHLDHVAGNRFIYDELKLLPIYHANETSVIDRQQIACSMYGLPCDLSPKAETFLNEGELFQFGVSELEVIFTPGHSPGHVVFYNRKQNMVINGDVLFHGSIGRTDLPGGDHDTLIKSIKTKMFALPDETIVYCGHGPETSIRQEKIHNPYVHL